MKKISIDDEILKKYQHVGKIVRNVLEYAINVVQPGTSILEICEKIEQKIKSYNVEPAFPVNVSINDIAAHYTAEINDITEIPKNSIVKIDIGAHLDGYIVDAAITITFNTYYDYLVKSVVKALKSVISIMKHGVTLSYIGSIIEKSIKAYGFKPIKNLTGHLISRYELHAGKSIPNFDNGDNQKVFENEIYAIEPFATNGAGYVKEINKVTIFKLLKYDVKHLNDDTLRKVVENIWSKVKTLPFTPRWFVKDFGTKIIHYLNRLIDLGIVYGYPVLVEVNKGYVAQVEDTVIVVKDGVIPLVNTLEFYE